VPTGLYTVIDALRPDVRSHEIRTFFDDKLEQIDRLKLDISHGERELNETTLPKSSDHIFAHHNKLIASLKTRLHNPEDVHPVRQTCLVQRL